MTTATSAPPTYPTGICQICQKDEFTRLEGELKKGVRLILHCCVHFEQGSVLAWHTRLKPTDETTIWKRELVPGDQFEEWLGRLPRLADPEWN